VAEVDLRADLEEPRHVIDRGLRSVGEGGESVSWNKSGVLELTKLKMSSGTPSTVAASKVLRTRWCGRAVEIEQNCVLDC
jgi:hypothetical protein